MPNYKHPGVYVEESLSPSYAASLPNLSSAAFVGPINRGPTAPAGTGGATPQPLFQGVPTVVNSWSEYVARYGSFEDPTLFLPMAVYAFFNNGGQRAWICRVVGANASKASVVLSDRAATPAQTLTVTAENEGVWGNALYVDVVDRAGGRFDFLVRYNGTSDANIVERWLDLSMSTSDSRYAPSVINNPTAGSLFVTLTDMASATGAPNNNPAVTTGSQQLTGGANGNAPSATDVLNSINALATIQEPFNLNLPGDSNISDIAAAVNFSDPAQGGRGDVFVVIDPPVGQTVNSLTSSFVPSLPASSYSALYYPWLQAVDPASSSPGAIRKLPAGGFVLGKFAETDAARGVFKAPAGLGVRLNSVAGLEAKLTSTDLDTLNTSQVNAIRNIPGSGVCIMGARTLKTTPQTDRYVPVRRSLIFLKQSLLALTQYAIFEPNDHVLWDSLTNTITQFLQQYWQSGGLAGEKQNEAFYVQCNAENNPPAKVAAGEVHVETGVALQQPAEFIIIRIGQWSGGQSAVVIQ